MAKGSRALANCRIVLVGFSHTERNKTSKWISNLGGSTNSSVNEHTTHVIASEKAWSEGYAAVQLALDENEDRVAQKGKEKALVKIVNFAWIEDSSVNRAKKSETPYLWEKSRSKKKSIAKGNEGVTKNHQGMLKETVLECTEQHVDEEEQRRQDKEMRFLEVEEQMQKTAEEETRKKQAQIFKKGAKKARNEIFSENHHIYTDGTGFQYDIQLTKVDTRMNRNERYALTIQLYESNAEPHTYATNLNFAGTSILPSNNVLAALGTNYPTAFHMFKAAFKEKTGVEWDDRVAFAFRKIKAERAAKGLAMGGGGSEAGGSRAGVPVASEVVRSAEGKRVQKKFEDMVFEYNPPRYGPSGAMSKEKEEEVRRLIGAEEVKKDGNGVGKETGSTSRVEAWMSGPNVVGGGSQDQSKSSRGKKGGESIDLTADGDYDFGDAPAAQRDGIAGDEMTKEEFEDLVDETYPFPQDYSEHFGLTTNDNTGAVSKAPDTTADLHNTANNESAPDREVETSFDTAPTNDATHGEISFDQPPSTIIQSFQPGTQDVGDTQIAERAKGEFEEVMQHEELAAADGNGIGGNEGVMKGSRIETAAGGLTKGLQLGGSILGKRKKAEASSEDIGQTVKKMKHAGDEGREGEANNLPGPQLNGEV